jgi:hypothetical protein
MWQLFKEFLAFLKQEKKWWLIPLGRTRGQYKQGVS